MYALARSYVNPDRVAFVVVALFVFFAVRPRLEGAAAAAAHNYIGGVIGASEDRRRSFCGGPLRSVPFTFSSFDNRATRRINLPPVMSAT